MDKENQRQWWKKLSSQYCKIKCPHLCEETRESRVQPVPRFFTNFWLLQGMLPDFKVFLPHCSLIGNGCFGDKEGKKKSVFTTTKSYLHASLRKCFKEPSYKLNFTQLGKFWKASGGGNHAFKLPRPHLGATELLVPLPSSFCAGLGTLCKRAMAE